MVEARSKGLAKRPRWWLTRWANVAESASANVLFMVKDGEFSTPIPKRTFLARYHTRKRAHGEHAPPTGFKGARKTVLQLDDFHAADEVFFVRQHDVSHAG